MKYSQTPLYGHPHTDTSLLRRVCFVPGERKPFFTKVSLRAGSLIWASEVSLARTRERGAATVGHPINTDTFYGPPVSILTGFDCKMFGWRSDRVGILAVVVR